jgi:hypothetical protein
LREGRELHLLTSPGILAGLALLLANDFLFKPLFHNALTGKLSDFAGLFVFPLFWSALLPRRRREAYALSALGFVFWKSSHSQTLIDAWNALGVLNVGRVVDPTDLMALAVLPFSYVYARRATAPPPSFVVQFAGRRLATCAVVFVSLFAFTATQMADERTSGFQRRKYHFRMTSEELLARLSELKSRGVRLERQEYLSVDSYGLHIAAKFCKTGVRAQVNVYQQGDDAVLELNWIEYWCDEDGGPEHDRQLVELFEKQVVAALPPPTSVEEVEFQKSLTPTPSPTPSPARPGGGKMPEPNPGTSVPARHAATPLRGGLKLSTFHHH